MARYTRDDLIKEHQRIHNYSPAKPGEKDFFIGIPEKRAKLMAEQAEYTAFAFYNAPKELQQLCCLNGGDEDAMLITKLAPDDLPYWINSIWNHTDVDIYELDGFYIYVSSHS